MLSENIKNLRKAKGLSQEELAIKLNVVRQTVSKWEKGISVPDCEIIIRIAESLGVTVSELLGEAEPPCETDEINVIAAKLELLNEQFARQNERRRKIWQIIFTAVCVLSAGYLLTELSSLLHSHFAMNAMRQNLSIIGGADAPTRIYVANAFLNFKLFIAASAAAVLSAAGIYKTRRR